MNYREFDFKSYTDGLKIAAYKFMPDRRPVAIIQISHGMAEKALRYSSVAESFVSRGFGVYINDHRGHGKSAHKKYGYMGEGDVFLKMVRDMRSLNRIIARENPGVPVVLLGNSMGSFLAQRYVQIYPETVEMLLLSGSNGRNQIPVSKVGKIVAKTMMTVMGSEKEAELIRNAQDLMFNKKIRNRSTKSDWLSTNESEVGKYVQSSDMGFSFTTSAYYYLFNGICQNFNGINLRRIPEEMPVLIFSGDRDPVGDYGKGPENLEKMYRKNGLKNVQLMLYENRRHDLFNEGNREQVIEDVTEFIKKNLPS